MRGKTKNWMRLDNAAKIYPAAKKRGWMSLFRLSANLNEIVNPGILERALEITIKRFPSMAVKLRRGLFWYYLEQAEGFPKVAPDAACPCTDMDIKGNGGFAFRVRYYEKRIALEVFHVLTDGTGGMFFLKTLIAKYLRLRHGVQIPRGAEIFDCNQRPDPEELEDSFLKNSGHVSQGRGEATAYHITGTPEDHFTHLTTGIMPAAVVKQKAAEKGVSITELLVAVMVAAADELQRQEVKSRKKLKPVKIMVPVNLRRFFPSRTMRNFSLYVSPGIDPRMGTYTLDEILQVIHHAMGSEVTAKQLSAKFTANVKSERNVAIRVLPLFLKNLAMKFAYNLVGERKTCMTLTNLGLVKLPAEMEDYVTRMDFVLGPLSKNPLACACVSYQDKLYFNTMRKIAEPKWERLFYTKLVRMGIPVKIESNLRE